MGKMKYDISKFVYTTELTKEVGDKVRDARLRYTEARREIKKILFSEYRRQGYFSCLKLSEDNQKLLDNGFSPTYIDIEGNERQMFNVHHIIPLSFGGKPCTPSNLIPIPIKFHQFVHSKVIDPQTQHIHSTQKRRVIGMPDFKKITLEMMMDNEFINDYEKYMNNYFAMQRLRYKKHKRDR